MIIFIHDFTELTDARTVENDVLAVHQRVGARHVHVVHHHKRAAPHSLHQTKVCK